MSEASSMGCGVESSITKEKIGQLRLGKLLMAIKLEGSMI